MTSYKHFASDIAGCIKAQWTKLTDEDVHHGLQHRGHLLERLHLRHGLSLDEAQAQLHAFEKRNPELLFERS
jgi:hypothetical protein